MADGSHIEWTDATWNPVRGCSRVSPGCGGANHEGGCYAEKIAARFSGPGQPFEGFARRTPHGGQWTGKLALVESALDLPLRWKRPRRIFVNSMSDLFHENLTFRQIDRVIEVTRDAPHHTYQILTKRAERAREFAAWWCTQHAENSLPSCIWLGVSVEDQARADERIPLLLDTPAAVRFISAEPLLGPVDIRPLVSGGREAGPAGATYGVPAPRLDWVITGGESGPHARGALREWYRSIRDQCQAARVAYFHKQNGEWIDADEWLDGFAYGIAKHGERWRPERPLSYRDAEWLAESLGWTGRFEHHSDGSTLIRVGKHAAGRLLDGKTWSEFPSA